ncbi:hypothetical protein [Stenotrophomonas sp. PSU_St99]
MSILNVLISRDQLVIAVDTLAEDALTGAHSAGAKMLLIPQHNVLLADRDHPGRLVDAKWQDDGHCLWQERQSARNRDPADW